jgi:oligopeptide/dipeptide ABC transporter ATP-binding protein
MLDPKLIIADEAVSSLDVSVGAQILNLFQDLHQRLGLSLLFISHNLNVVYYLCDRIAVMYRGQIVELGAAGDIYATPAHPYTQTLLAAIPELIGERPAEPGGVFTALPAPRAVDAVSPAEETRNSCRYARLCPRRDKCNGEDPGTLVNIAQEGKEPHYARCVLAGR